jgi:cytochrome b
MDITTWLILGYFALLALNLRKRWGVIDGPWLFFFRAFFPNWKFYHGIQLAPRLYVRGQFETNTWTDWHLIYPRMPRKAFHLFHNPTVNLALAHQNLVDHLANDINDMPEGADIRDRVTYQLVDQLAHQAISGACWGDARMLSRHPTGAPTAYQFEVRMELPDGQNSQLMLQSPVVTP